MRGCKCRRSVQTGRVVTVVVLGTLHQRGSALHAHDLTGHSRQRQSEITQPAKPVDDPFLARRREQRQSAGHQRAVDMGVDLREVSRAKRHDHVKLRQGIRQWCGLVAAALRQEDDGVRPLGLQPPLHARVRYSEVLQAGYIVCAQRLQVPQHQGGRGDARWRWLAHRQFNLRNEFGGIHGSNQPAQRQQHGADVRRQHGALRHIGHKMAFALVKTNQYHALFAHEAHRQTGPVAVAPCRPFNGAQDHSRHHFADVREVVFHHTLFDRDLRCRMQMLHLATAA